MNTEWIDDSDSASWPVRSIPVPDELWDPAAALAAKRGETPADIMRLALAQYVQRG